MARPKAGEEKGASKQIGVRVSPEIRERLEAMAAKAGHGLTDEVRAALERHTGLGSTVEPKAKVKPASKRR